MSIALVIAAPAAVVAAAPTCATSPGTSAAYPTFCGIPQAPKDVRSAAEFKAAVVSVRRAGQRLVQQTAPATFGLSGADTEAFGQAARIQSAWPGGTASPETDTDAFSADAQRLVTPPPRHPR